CRSCGATGFRGRLPIAEILTGSADFEARVASGDTVERIAEAARKAGMRSLWGSGLAHVAAGRTTIAEVRRVATEDRVAPVPIPIPIPSPPPTRRLAEAPARASIGRMAELRIGRAYV